MERFIVRIVFLLQCYFSGYTRNLSTMFSMTVAYLSVLLPLLCLQSRAWHRILLSEAHFEGSKGTAVFVNSGGVAEYFGDVTVWVGV